MRRLTNTELQFASANPCWMAPPPPPTPAEPAPTPSELLHVRLASAVTDYDRRESTKRFYNRYALAMYCGAIQETCAAIDAGTPVREAILKHFSGRLLNTCLKAAGEAPVTPGELL